MVNSYCYTLAGKDDGSPLIYLGLAGINYYSGYRIIFELEPERDSFSDRNFSLR